jgi:hypothetical protein
MRMNRRLLVWGLGLLSAITLAVHGIAASFDLNPTGGC